VAQLSETGVDVTYQGQSLKRSFFLPAAHLININGQDVRVFTYDSVKALEEDASKISLDGTTLDLTSVLWIAPPRFYARAHTWRSTSVPTKRSSTPWSPFSAHPSPAMEPCPPTSSSTTPGSGRMQP